MNFFQTILTEGLPVFNLVAIFAFKIIAKQHEAHSPVLFVGNRKIQEACSRAIALYTQLWKNSVQEFAFSIKYVIIS